MAGGRFKIAACHKLERTHVMPRRTLAALSTQNVIYAAIAGNLIVAATKLAAALFTGSSAMLSEAVHSFVDTGNSVLLLYGIHRSKARPNRDHPFGFGREIYFWSFVVAVLVFALGAGISLYEGVLHIISPEPIQNVRVNYIVLAISALFDGATWLISLKNFQRGQKDKTLILKIHDSKDPPSFMNLFEDSAALIGLAIAFVGTYLSLSLNMPVLDGVASILIGLVLAITAGFLAYETKGLLIGEPADPLIVKSILTIAKNTDGIANANGIVTLHLAPQQIMVALSLEFADELKTPDIEQRVVDLEARLRAAHPYVVAVFVKPQTSDQFKAAAARRQQSEPYPPQL